MSLRFHGRGIANGRVVPLSDDHLNVITRQTSPNSLASPRATFYVRRSLLLALVLWTIPASAWSQLTDQQVARAIARGERLPDSSLCIGSNVAGEFSVCVQGPEQRIALEAAVAKQAHRRLRPEDVPADVRTPSWTVVIRPNPPALVDGRPVRAPHADDVTLQSRDNPATAMKPVKTVPIPMAWKNAVGLTLTSQGLTATFETDNLPEHDLEIVVTGDGGLERRYILSEGARQQIH